MNKRKTLTIALMLIALFGMLYLATGKPAQAAMGTQRGNAHHPNALLSSQTPWEFQTVEAGHLFGRWSNRAIAIDSNGNLHFAYGGGYLYYYDGESIQVVDRTEGVGLYASLALDGSEYPHIAYYDTDNDALKYAYYDGSQWHTETVDADPDGNVGKYASLALDESGNPHIAYYDNDNEMLKYAYYDGEQWHIEIVDNAGDVGEEASLALDASGHPHISYYDDDNEDLKYAYYDGSQWHIETVDSEGDVGDYTSLALDEAGHPHISYYDRSNDDLKYAYYDGSQWHIETVDSEGDVGLYTSLALDSSGNPHISYLDYDNKVPKYAYYDGEQWHTEVVDNSNGRRGYYSSLALDNAGHPHMVYYDEMSDIAIYAHHDGSQWQIQTLDEKRDRGLYASIAVDSSGYPHIAYVQRVKDEVKYAYYNGEQWQIETVTNAYARCTSLALDNDGHPHIAYMAQGSNYHYYLEYAFYDGTQWHIQTVDSNLYNLGSCLSLGLDSSGNPHIAYYVWDENQEGNNLKYSYYDGSSWHGEVVEEGGSDSYLEDLSLAIDSNGHPRIAYYSYDYNNGGSKLKYAYYDGSQWHFDVVTSGSVYEDISLALDSNDLPHIAYNDTYDEALKYTYYDGEEWNIETVEDSINSSASMKLDSNGNPHIAYFDLTNLKYAYYGGGQWNIEILKSNPTISYISLALDPSDHPHIAYRSDFSLKYAYGTEVPPTPTPGATSTPATPTPTPLPPTPTPTPTFTTTPPSPTPTPTVTPTPTGNVFSDVPDDFWAVDYINRLYNDGITSGCATDPLQFCPSDNATRAQIAVFLLRAMHYPDEYTPPPAEATFTDTANSWAKDWIEALKAAGVTQGYPDGSYRPNNPVTRAEMAVFLLRAIHGGDYSPPPVEHSRFTDVPDDYWAKDWIEELAAEEITSGYPDGTYRPGNPVSRAEMAVFLVRAFGLP